MLVFVSPAISANSDISSIYFISLKSIEGWGKKTRASPPITKTPNFVQISFSSCFFSFRFLVYAEQDRFPQFQFTIFFCFCQESFCNTYKYNKRYALYLVFFNNRRDLLLRISFTQKEFFQTNKRIRRHRCVGGLPLFNNIRSKLLPSPISFHWY